MTRIGSRTIIVICIGLLIAFALAGCSTQGGTKPTGGGYGSGAGTPPTDGGSATALVITEEDLAFSPSSITVKVGDTITFENADSAPHNVMIADQVLDTHAPGESVTWKATTAGTFPYSCGIHPSMTGTVIVK